MLVVLYILIDYSIVGLFRAHLSSLVSMPLFVKAVVLERVFAAFSTLIPEENFKLSRGLKFLMLRLFNMIHRFAKSYPQIGRGCNI